MGADSQARFSENISLNELSKYCYVSPFHFARLFKTVMGIPPHKYLLNIRLQHAKFLLVNSAKPVTESTLIDTGHYTKPSNDG